MVDLFLWKQHLLARTQSCGSFASVCENLGSAIIKIVVEETNLNCLPNFLHYHTTLTLSQATSGPCPSVFFKKVTYRPSEQTLKVTYRPSEQTLNLSVNFITMSSFLLRH